MRNKLLFLLCAFLACFGSAKADIWINSVYFPDSGFRTWVQKHFDKPNGAKLTDEELASVKEIISWKDGFHVVENLKGIEYFSELETLRLFNNRYNFQSYVVSVDLSKNKKLKKFTFTADEYFRDYNSAPEITHQGSHSARIPISGREIAYLESVNLKNLPNLETVVIDEHRLSALDLRGCPNLKCVEVTNGGNLTSIQLDTCKKLETFNCCENFSIGSLDLLLMPNLKSLKCDYNKIESLDLSASQNLETLSCVSNSLTRLDLSNCKKLITINCEKCPLTSLDCSQLNLLTNIDFSECNQMEDFPKLPKGIKSITCERFPPIANADLSLFPDLTNLKAPYCELKAFDASKCRNLVSLDLWGNHIAALDLSGLNHLDYKSVDIPQKITLGVERIPNKSSLWRLYLPENVDLDKIYSYDYISDLKRFNYTLYAEYYTDDKGTRRPSFVTNFLYSGSNSTNIIFSYSYKTNLFYEKDGKQTELLMDAWVAAKQVPSGVEDLAAEKTVKGVVYYDLQGHESAVPFSGFNIEVTQFTDGTSQSKKIIK